MFTYRGNLLVTDINLLVLYAIISTKDYKNHKIE